MIKLYEVFEVLDGKSKLSPITLSEANLESAFLATIFVDDTTESLKAAILSRKLLPRHMRRIFDV